MNYTRGTANDGGGASSTTFNVPLGVALDSTNHRLFVSESKPGNNRVLVFDVASITSGENAQNVLGQATFTSSTAATTQNGMSSPRGLAYDATNKRLFVLEDGNHRLVLNSVP